MHSTRNEKPRVRTHNSGNRNHAATTRGGHESSFANKREFIEKMWPIALEIHRETGIDPMILITMAGHETGWGKSFAGANNLFNIKAAGSKNEFWKGATSGTIDAWEMENGVNTTQKSKFRAYDSIEDSMRDFAQFVSKGRYSEAWKVRDNPAQFFKAIHKAGYATDTAYSNKLINIASSLQRQMSTGG